MALQPSPGRRVDAPLPGFGIFILLVPCFLLFLLFLLGAMQYKQVKSLMSPAPLSLPPIADSTGSRAHAVDTLRAFFQGNTRDTLALDAAQLDALVGASEALRKAGWEYRMGLEDTLFTAANSLPVGKMKGPASLVVKLMRMHGYLNSVLKGYPIFKDGRLELTASAATMNGADAPQSALSRNGNVDVREWVEDKSFYDDAVAKLSDVKIAGGRLLLIKRR